MRHYFNRSGQSPGASEHDMTSANGSANDLSPGYHRVHSSVESDKH